MSLDRAVILLFSILLLTQSVFGSPFKQDNHVKRIPESPCTNVTEIQGRQGLSSIYTPKEGDEKNKRDVIIGNQLNADVLTRFLNNLGTDVDIKVAIGVDNESGYQWKVTGRYFDSGTSDNILPSDVASGKALLYGAHKKSMAWAGAVGLLTYHIPQIGKTLAVMYSVPYSHRAYSNKFDVRLYDGKKTANYDLYAQMDDGNPFEGDGSWHHRYLGAKLRVKGTMSIHYKATLEIHVQNVCQA